MIDDDMILGWRCSDANCHNMCGVAGFNRALSGAVDACTITASFPLNPAFPVGHICGFSCGIPFNGALFADLTRDFIGSGIISVHSLPGFNSSPVLVDANELYLNCEG